MKKRGLSLLLAILMVAAVFSPAFPSFVVQAEAASDATGTGSSTGSGTVDGVYATIITASDFQDGRSGNLYEEAFSTMIQKAKANGLREPDGFILGGDYEGSYAEDHDTPTAYRRVESLITTAYPYFNKKNITNIQGNHDINDPSVIDKTGPHEYDDYIVYVINNSDYPAGTGGTAAYNKTLQTNENLVAYFNKLKAEGDTRPIFIATHIPLHHNSRNPKANNKDAQGNVVSTGYNETLYSRILFDTLNEQGKTFDIIFLFGHNHSGNYDDYLGGSVNYLGKGDTIRIPDYNVTPSETSYTEETLNFTYMNYGYVGYTNNDNNKTLTMSTFEFCPGEIVVTRYSVDGQYGKAEVIDRNMKTDTPSVIVDGYSEGKVGSATGVVAISSGVEDPVYTWSSSNESVASVSYSDRVARITYLSAGTATIRVKVADRNNSSKNAVYTYDVTVTEDAGATPGVAIHRVKEQVDGRELEYYQATLGDTVALSGSYSGLTTNASATWSSSNTGVAKVNQYGLVTFVGPGTANITYTATDNGVTYTAEVKFIISTEKKVEYKYVQTTTITAGKSYVIASDYGNVKAIYTDRLAAHDNVIALSGTVTAFEGSAGSYHIQLDDDAFVWNAVRANGDNQVYLQNADSGLYLAAYATGKNDIGGSTNLGYYELTKAKPSNGIWQFTGNVLQTTEGLKWYTRSNGVGNITSGTGRETIIFEQVALESYAEIEFTGDVVNGTTQTVYLAVSGRQIELERECTNVQQIQSETWSSSNTDVAVIDNNGVVTFRGVDGDTVITYTATDAITGKTVTASFTLKAVLTAESTRYFKYVETVTPGKKYVIVSTNTEGSALAFSSFEVSYTKLLGDRIEVTVEDGASYVEIPEHLLDVVWTPESAGGSSFYLKSDSNGKYLYANTDGTYDDYNSLATNVFTSASYGTNTSQFVWTYEGGSKLYNNFAYTDAKLGAQSKTYVRVRTAEFLGTATQSESKAYFFEEIPAKPKAVITSRYEVLGEKVERTQICPFQTEQLLPTAQNFPDNTKVTFAWSSGNTTIATIDQNGKITYTGKKGEVEITLTATSLVQDSTGAYPVATSTVTIEVIGGAGYVDPADTTYAENAFYKTTRFVPGRRYVMHTSYSDAPNLAISNQNKSGYVRLLCEAIDAPQTDENGEYVVTTNNNFIWECIESDIGGYYLLRNVGNGQYFFTSESESTTAKHQAGVAANLTHPEAANVTNAEDTFLIKYEVKANGTNEYGMLFSKQVVESGVAYGVGNVAKSSSGYYYFRPTTPDSSGSVPNSITLYEEPVKNSSSEEELPDGDVYVLTDSLVIGNKYVIANSNVAGGTKAISKLTHSTWIKGIDATVETATLGNYIANPSDDILVFEVVASSVDGYVKLKTEDGKYLVGSKTANPRVANIAEAGAYDESYYLFKYTGSRLKISDGSNELFIDNANNEYRCYISSAGSNLYLYALMERTTTPDEPETTEVITQIRKQEEFGSLDITRTIQYRYDVGAGDTEQILRYIRGVEFGYTTEWSVSDNSIATIDKNGLLTYTGNAGYVDVILTITGTDFAGNDITRTLKTTFNVSADQDKTRIAIPETVYMTPASGASTVGQVYVNNVMNADDSYNIETVAASQDNMYFGLRVVRGKSFTISVSNATNPSNDINLYTISGASVSESTVFNFDSNGVFESDEQYSLRFSGAGLQPGEKATAKWTITVTMNEGTTKVYTLYTVMYAPDRTVGAVAEARQVEKSQNEIASWITGANGVDHTQQAPLGTIHADKRAFGYFKEDPLVAGYQNAPTISGSGETANDHINVGANANEYYVMQAATDGHDGSRSQSYLGLLTVDSSRYTNTNQIPNLRIGYDVFRRGEYVKDSVHTFNSYYVLGTASSFTASDLDATPSGWIEYNYYVNFAESHNLPYRETVVPGFNVSDIDGKYIHAIARSQAIQDLVVRINRQYATAGTSLLCTVTDKSTLRERVLAGYNITDGTNDFYDVLQDAATILGDPAATQTEIDEVSRELYEAMAEKADKYYTLKYDNIFSAFEYSQFANSMTVAGDRGTASYLNGTITVKNDALTDATEAYTNYGSGSGYYLVDLKPNTEYVFEYVVTTDVSAQAFMFFYNASGGNAEAPTNMSIKVNDGAWSAKSESNSWWGNYTSGAGTYHYAIKFTTGATTVKASFRFGNTSNSPVESTFSNIKLIESAYYYEDATYSKTESIHKEYTAYGTLITPVRPGYIFLGWEDAHGITVTGDNSATENLTIYSQWKEVQYTVNYDGNFGAGSKPSEILTITKNGTTPNNAEFTRDNHTLLGWAFDIDATAPDFGVGQTITVADVHDHINNNNQVTLYAVWERNYSVYYSSNGGTGTVAHTYNPRSQAHTLPDDSTISRDGYMFLGWALTPDATEPDYQPGDKFYIGNIDPQYVNETKQEVILHAVWKELGPQNVTFDNLVDISKWSTTAGNGTIVNPTDIGFTVKSNEGVGEATCSSAYFTIEAGHKYVVDVDVKGDNWDIYFFFCDANGNWVNFSDSGNRLASYGLNVSKVEGTRYTSIEFTAPAGAVNAQLRVDANGSNNAVRFENIRVYDTANTTYLNTVNKYVEYGEAYGELPVPVKEGQQFLGWVDEKGNTVTADSIMNSLDTVYLTSTWTTNANTANDDTVIIEYGSSVTINVLANDKSGTVSGIGTTGVSDAVLGSVSHPSSALTNKANTLTLDAGTAKLNGDGTITFTPSNTNVSDEIVFYYELNVSGAYYYAKVTIIPATTIYFEDTFFTFKDSTVTSGGKTYNYNWQNLGTSVGDVFQSTDRPGTFNFADDANNVYGYDPKSDGQVSYSGGSAHFVEVDKIAGTSAPTATFTFTGTGFDLFSVTDNKSGTVTVTIYSGTTADASNRVMGVMSNAYFGYGYDSESDSLVATDNGALFQVPLIRAHDLSYGTYTVVVQPRYNYAFDVAKTGKSGVYVDSVRIYDPMGDENTVANNAYKADGEYAPQYLEVRDTLVASNKDGSFTVSDLGLGKSVFLDGGKTSMDDFANLGPKNEVYLQNGNSIAFHIVTDRAELPSTIQMGMKLTGKGGTTATVNLMNSEYNGWSQKVILNSTEERYYNIEAVVDWVQQPDGTFKTASPVIVTNTSDAIISLTSIKWAFDSEGNTATVLNLMADMDTPVLAMAALMRVADPQVNPQQTILNKDNISYKFDSESYATGETGTLTITTEQGVYGVTVNATDVLDCATNEDGKLEWTFEFTAESVDSMTFEIIARDEDGITSEAIYATVAIEAAADDGENDVTEPDDGTADDTTEPDDEITDDTTGGSGIGGLVGVDSFAANLVNNIFALIAKVLSLLFGGVMA